MRRCSRRSRTGSPSRSDYLPALQEQVAAALASRRRPLRARPHRRQAPSRSSCESSRSRRSSSACLVGVEAEARSRDVRLEAVGAERSDGPLRAREDRARPAQPAHERAPPHAHRRLCRSRSSSPTTTSPRHGRGHRRGHHDEGVAADVRPLLARRSRHARRRVPGSASRSPADSSKPRADDLGRAARGRRHERFLHASRVIEGRGWPHPGERQDIGLRTCARTLLERGGSPITQPGPGVQLLPFMGPFGLTVPGSGSTPHMDDSRSPRSPNSL